MKVLGHLGHVSNDVKNTSAVYLVLKQVDFENPQSLKRSFCEELKLKNSPRQATFRVAIDQTTYCKRKKVKSKFVVYMVLEKNRIKNSKFFFCQLKLKNSLRRVLSGHLDQISYRDWPNHALSNDV